jgi:hypothetical protein
VGLFGKKKKPMGSGLDIPPAPPPVKVTKQVAAAPPKEFEPEKPEFPTMPDIPPPPGKLPSFEEGLEKEKSLPPIKERIRKEVPPPPMEDIPPPPPSAKMRPKPAPPPRPVHAEAPPQMPSFEAVEEEISSEERAEMGAHAHGPIFVRADNYKYVLDELSVARNIAKESSDIFTRIADMGSVSEQHYERWRLCLEDVERKMLFVDKSLFGR